MLDLFIYLFIFNHLNLNVFDYWFHTSKWESYGRFFLCLSHLNYLLFNKVKVGRMEGNVLFNNALDTSEINVVILN